MSANVFKATLREQRGAILGWSIGMLALGLFVLSLYPTFAGNPVVVDFIRRMPPQMLAFLGVDPDVFSTGIGYVQAQLYSFMAPMLVLWMAIGLGAGATAGEEETGTADMLLAQPISRTRVIMERFAALAVACTTVVTMLAMVLAAGNGFADLKLPLRGIIGVNVGLLTMALLHGAVAMAVGAWTGGRGAAAAVATTAAVAAMFVNGFAPVSPALARAARLTSFHWYLDGLPAKNGVTVGHILLMATTAAVVGLAILAFNRRDLRTAAPLHFPERVNNDARKGRLRRERRRRAPWLARHLLVGVYGKTIWEKRLTIFAWAMGLCSLAALTMAFWPTLSADPGNLAAMIQSIPKEMFATFGFSDPTVMMTPAGFVSSRVYATAGLILMIVFAAGMGTGAVAGEEARGTMDLQLAVPLRRRSIVLARFAAMATLVAALGTAIALTLWIGGNAMNLGFRPLPLVAANVGLALTGLFFGALALCVGAVTGRPEAARAATLVVAIGGFVVNGLGAAVDWLGALRLVSPMYWFLRDAPPLTRGFGAGMFPLLFGALALVAIAVVGFERRDVKRGG